MNYEDKTYQEIRAIQDRYGINYQEALDMKKIAQKDKEIETRSKSNHSSAKAVVVSALITASVVLFGAFLKMKYDLKNFKTNEQVLDRMTEMFEVIDKNVKKVYYTVETKYGEYKKYESVIKDLYTLRQSSMAEGKDNEKGGDPISRLLRYQNPPKRSERQLKPNHQEKHTVRILPQNRF